MQKTILFAIALLLCGPLFGQNTFHKKGTNGYFFSSTVLNDGGLLCLGTQDRPFAFPQGLLVRLNPTGEVIWQKRLPATNFIRYALETDSGFLIVGDSSETAGQVPRPRYTIVSALTPEGNVIWSSVIGSPNEQIIPSKMLKTSDGAVIAVSSNQLIRIGESGNTLWNKRYFVSNNNILEQIIPQYIEGDTLFACGQVQGNGAFIRISLSTGLPISMASFGGIYLEDLTSLQPTQDHNFIVSGFTRSTTGSEESRPWVVKVNRLGQIIWSKTYNLLGTSLDSQMAGTPDGGIVLSIGGDNASSTSYGILAKIDASGNPIWAYNYSSGEEFGLVCCGWRLGCYRSGQCAQNRPIWPG